MNYFRDFEEKGFVIVDDIWPILEISRFEKIIESRLDKILSTFTGNINFSSIQQKLQYLEQQDKALFCSFSGDIGATISGMQLCTSGKIIDILTELASAPAYEFLFTIPTLFWNDPATPRLHYKWHQESSYLDTYEKNYNLWTPLFSDLTENDGPMLVCIGSHRDSYEFTAYKHPNGVTQLEISEEIVSRFEIFPCALKKNQAIIFHHNLIHMTGQNLTNVPRTSLIIRYFDVKNQVHLNPPICFRNPSPPKKYLNENNVSKRDFNAI